MSNNFVLRKTLYEIVSNKVEPFIEKIFDQCDFESVQTSLLIEELVDSFSNQENFNTFKQILQLLFKPHVALTYDEFKKGQFSKKLINLLFQYKFQPTYVAKDEDIEAVEDKAKKEDDEIIEETHLNKISNEFVVVKTQKDEFQCVDKVYQNIDNRFGFNNKVPDEVHNRISYKNELVSVIEELKCENQFLKTQNENLITGNPHAHCEIMNQQLIEELKQLECELKNKRKEKQKTIMPKSEDTETSSPEMTDGFLLLDLLRTSEDEGETNSTDFEDMDDDSSYEGSSGTYTFSGCDKMIKRKLPEVEGDKSISLLEMKIQQIDKEKTSLLEENERLKKEIEIRQKIRDTEVQTEIKLAENITSPVCDHIDHNSTGTFEDLEELVSSIQNLEEENQAKDNIIQEYKSQLYELQCYMKLTRQGQNTTLPAISLTGERSTNKSLTSKSFKEELMELDEHFKSTYSPQDKNKSDSELLKAKYEFVSAQDNNNGNNTRLNVFDYEPSTTSEEDCDISRISHWDCSGVRKGFHVSNNSKDSITTDADVQTSLNFNDSLNQPTHQEHESYCTSDLISQIHEIHTTDHTPDLINTTDLDMEGLPSPILPLYREETVDYAQVPNYNMLAFTKNKRELIPKELRSTMFENSIPEETSDGKSDDTERKDVEPSINEQNAMEPSIKDQKENEGEPSINDISENEIEPSINDQRENEIEPSINDQRENEIEPNINDQRENEIEPSINDQNEGYVTCQETLNEYEVTDEIMYDNENVENIVHDGSNEWRPLEVIIENSFENDEAIVYGNDNVKTTNLQDISNELEPPGVVICKTSSEKDESMLNKNRTINEIKETRNKTVNVNKSQEEYQVQNLMEKYTTEEDLTKLVEDSESIGSTNDLKEQSKETEDLNNTQECSNYTKYSTKLAEFLTKTKGQNNVLQYSPEDSTKLDDFLKKTKDFSDLQEYSNSAEDLTKLEEFSKKTEDTISNTNEDLEKLEEFTKKTEFLKDSTIVSTSNKDLTTLEEFSRRTKDLNGIKEIVDKKPNEKSTTHDFNSEITKVEPSNTHKRHIKPENISIKFDGVNEEDEIADKNKIMVDSKEVFTNSGNVSTKTEKFNKSEDMLKLTNVDELFPESYEIKEEISDQTEEINKAERQNGETLGTDLDESVQLEEKQEENSNKIVKINSSEQNLGVIELPNEIEKIKDKNRSKLTNVDELFPESNEIKKEISDPTEEINKAERQNGETLCTDLDESVQLEEKQEENSNKIVKINSSEQNLGVIELPNEIEKIKDKKRSVENHNEMISMQNECLNHSGLDNKDIMAGKKATQDSYNIERNNIEEQSKESQLEQLDKTQDKTSPIVLEIFEKTREHSMNGNTCPSETMYHKEEDVISPELTQDNSNKSNNSSCSSTSSGNSMATIKSLKSKETNQLVPSTSQMCTVSPYTVPTKCHEDCTQCVNVKEVIDLFESLYRKNMNDAEYDKTSLTFTKRFGNDSCKKYKQILNQMNSKLKEIDIEFSNAAFRQYREPSGEYPIESHHILSEKLQKCLNELNESFHKTDADENNEDNNCKLDDLNELIQGFNCLKLREESPVLLREPTITVLDMNSRIKNGNPSETIIKDNKLVKQKSAKPLLNKKKSTKSAKTNKNESQTFKNNLQIISQAKDNEIISLSNDMGAQPNLSFNKGMPSLHVKLNRSLPTPQNELNNSQNILVLSTKDIVKKNATFDCNYSRTGNHYMNKPNNIDVYNERKVTKNKVDHQLASTSTGKCVELSKTLAPNKGMRRAQDLNQSCSLFINNRSYSTKSSACDGSTCTITIGSTICSFTLHMVRLFMSLLILTCFIIIALILYQQFRRTSPSCSQFLTFLGDLLAMKLEHLDGPPPI